MFDFIVDQVKDFCAVYGRVKEVRARIGDYGKISKEDEAYILGIDKLDEKIRNYTTVPEDWRWEIRRRIDDLVYSSVDLGDDRALRAEANRRIDALKDLKPGEERWEKWMRVYDLMSKWALVDFAASVDAYKAKKISEGLSKSPTGYDWSWLNLAVSNEYWRQLLIICIEIAEHDE